MEVRNITIVDTRSQSKTVVESDVTTVGELKTLLDNKGISYSDMDIFEGVSKTELNRDDQQLPSNIFYKGAITNNLVVMLSSKAKKITSGAMDRKEIIAKIKELNLQEKVKELFNDNYTRIKTVELERFLNDYTQEATPDTPKTVEKDKVPTTIEEKINFLAKCIRDIVDEQFDDKYLNILDNWLDNTKVESAYSDDEINDMINSL